jgi:hypothetical protein
MQVMRSGLSMASSGLFQAADKTARKIAAIAGYRHGMAQGMHQEEAYLYARDIVNKTNFDYSVADAPAAFRTITGDILLQFRKYGIKATELGMNHLNGFQKVKYWGGILALAGIPGVIPGFDFIAALVKFLFPEQDLKLAIKEGIDALPVPREMKLPLAYGAFANLGFDLSNRAGLSSILPSSWQDVPGPALGYIGQVFKGIASVSTGGDFIEEFKKLATGPANMMSAVTGKVKNASGKTVFEAETLGERLHLFTGFRSIRRSTEADAIAIANANKARESAARTDAIKAYLADKSPENRKALRDVGATIQQVKAQAKWGTGTNHEQAVQSAIRGKDRDTYDTLTGYMQ